MTGALIMRSGGPIVWHVERQKWTSCSSCESEIKATDCCTKSVLHIRLILEDLLQADILSHTPMFNDNQACVDWSKSTTTKGLKHLNQRENAIRESSIIKHEVTLDHIAGKINPSDLFTKELCDTSHFLFLHDSFMSRREDGGVGNPLIQWVLSPRSLSLVTLIIIYS
eukprot:scaffold64076_cov55-Attheya_sp.AAC.1